MHLQMSRILNIILVQAKNDEERSAIMAKGNMTIRMEPELKAQAEEVVMTELINS